jgi:hypothetical protein
MLYRLTFNLRLTGTCGFTGIANDLPLGSVIHLNDKVLAAAVGAAQMAPFQTLRLLEAAREARMQPGIDICCEAVELTQRQVDQLCLRSGKVVT